MIHVAQTYKGNLEEGLARHREAFQPKLEGAPCSLPVVNDENDVPRVKDYTHWIKEERLKEERLKAEMSQMIEESSEETCGQADGDAGDPRRTEEVTEAEAGFWG